MMTSFKQEHPSEPSPASQCFDPDNFINYDQAVLPTPSISPLSSRSKSVATPTSSSSHQNILLPNQPSQPTFAGPSHQYGDYRQQAGLPPGSLANTFAVNQVDPYGFGRGDQLTYSSVPTTDGYFGMNTTDDFLDFSSAPELSSLGDMDLDFNSNSPSDLSMTNASFVNPAAIGGEDNSSQALPTQTHPPRVYPGMHQQAALAKAQAEAQRQQQQQQVMEQQQQQQQQKASSHSRQTSKSGNNVRPPTDPIVEESISRLLNQMRHSSVASSNDDQAATPNANGSQSHSRTRKDEEDMDEDERLLASEEGKKLSSKERRQLRNKVSARAFRSRRKEYIGQLEGELAAKQSEADGLHAKNDALMAENKRLTDLTRMLLSSSAFSNFLNDLSNTGAPAMIPDMSGSQQSQQYSTSRPQSAVPPKDINPNQANLQSSSASQDNNMHVGMTMIPEESSFDYNAAETFNTGYVDNVNFGGLYDAQVYAITSVPQGPAVDSIDFTMLHGKSSNLVGPYCDSDDAKDEPVAIERMPSTEKSQSPAPIDIPSAEDDIDISDPAFALFNDVPSAPSSSSSCDMALQDCVFGEIDLEKAFGRVELIVEEDSQQTEDLSSATIERFERLCSRLDASSARIGFIIGDL